MRRALALFDLRDLFAVMALAGLALLTFGASEVFAPLRLIVPGVVLFALGLWKLR